MRPNLSQSSPSTSQRSTPASSEQSCPSDLPLAGVDHRKLPEVASSRTIAIVSIMARILRLLLIVIGVSSAVRSAQ